MYVCRVILRLARHDPGIGASDDPAIVAEEQELMERLRVGLKLHRLPPVLLGSGRTKAIHKFCAVAHAVYLETGTSSTLYQYLSEVLSTTSDMGTEFILAEMQPVLTREIFPWMLDDLEDVAALANVDELDDLPDVAAHSSISLQNSLSTPGLLHIIHNASNSVMSVMPTLKEAVTKMSPVADLIRRPESCKRLCATCFSDPVGVHFHAQLRQFQGHVHEERWGTIATCTRNLLRIKHVLLFGWSKDSFINGGHDAPVANKHGVDIQTVDEALTSVFWWALVGGNFEFR
jgi:hypothetical protein